MLGIEGDECIAEESILRLTPTVETANLLYIRHMIPSAELKPSSSMEHGDAAAPVSTAFKPNFRLYAIILGLGITNLLAAMENTVISIAAPVILTDLKLGDDFIWVTNAFFLSRYVLRA